MRKEPGRRVGVTCSEECGLAGWSLVELAKIYGRAIHTVASCLPASCPQHLQGSCMLSDQRVLYLQ